MTKFATCLLAIALLSMTASGPLAQTSMNNGEIVSQLIAWVKASGEEGVLEGRIAKAVGNGSGEDVPVKTRLLVTNAGGAQRLMVPNGSDTLVLRSLSGANERIWKASVANRGDIASLEAALFINWTGSLRSDRVSPTRGDDAFFAAVKTWEMERFKNKRGK